MFTNLLSAAAWGLGLDADRRHLTLWRGNEVNRGDIVVKLVTFTTKVFSFELAGSKLVSCSLKAFSRSACNNVVLDHLNEMDESQVDFKELGGRSLFI